jgi:hypothetical protein
MITLHFYHYWSHTGLDRYGNEASLWRGSKVSNLVSSFNAYNRCLLLSFDADYPVHYPEFAIKVLNCIDRLKSDALEDKESDQVKTWLGSLKDLVRKENPDSVCKGNHCEWDGETHMHYIYKDRVRLEPQGSSYQDGWPTWECPLSHYETALRGWVAFIQMPISETTELIIELPDEPDWPENGRFIGLSPRSSD